MQKEGFFKTQRALGKGFNLHSMQKIRNVLRRLGAGESQRSIALNEGIGKSTVGDIATGRIRGMSS